MNILAKGLDMDFQVDEILAHFNNAGMFFTNQEGIEKLGLSYPLKGEQAEGFRLLIKYIIGKDLIRLVKDSGIMQSYELTAFGIEVKVEGWLFHTIRKKAKEDLEWELASSAIKTNKNMRWSMWLTFSVALLTAVVLIFQYCDDEKPYDYRPALQRLLQQDSMIESRRIERELEYLKIATEKDGKTNGKGDTAKARDSSGKGSPGKPFTSY